MFAKKRVFEFHHHNLNGPIKIKAVNEQKAWEILRSFIKMQMFGAWALSYDKARLERELALVVCKQE